MSTAGYLLRLASSGKDKMATELAQLSQGTVSLGWEPQLSLPGSEEQ